MYSVFAMAFSVSSNFVAFWLAWISSISLWEGQKFTLKNLHFWDQLKASFSSNTCPDCISCHLEFQNFLGEDTLPTKRGESPLSDSPPLMPVGCPVSAYFQKFSVYLKTFWEPWVNTPVLKGYYYFLLVHSIICLYKYRFIQTIGIG